ncbi:unannotated protein [freshwater metagenome]|uniref:Unannotated protein n=1 Tax=freshwater metagenome TaxID=449393 RepID=A0A6J7EMU6_9ZZZZ|nr:hypothetical protein [Actinomycetota bacterium]
MPRRIRSRLTYANLTATLALFIALGGVSYAAVKLPANSVGTAQIKSNAVTGAKVKNKSLTAADFNGSVQGPQGLPGKDFTAAAVTVRTPVSETVVPAGGGEDVIADCLADETVIGGGYRGPIPTAGFSVTRNQPSENGWLVAIHNSTGGQEGFRAYAICLKTS